MNGNEQGALEDLFSRLSGGNLDWDVANDLCGQTGVICDDSSPYQSVIKLYEVFLLILSF